MVEIFKPTGGIEKVECELAIIWNIFDIDGRSSSSRRRLARVHMVAGQPAAMIAPLLFHSDGDHVERPGTHRFCHHHPLTPKSHAAVSQNIIRETESPTKATVLFARRSRASRRPRRGGSQGILRLEEEATEVPWYSTRRVHIHTSSSTFAEFFSTPAIRRDIRRFAAAFSN